MSNQTERPKRSVTLIGEATTVGELRQKIESFQDDCPVFVQGDDGEVQLFYVMSGSGEARIELR